MIDNYNKIHICNITAIDKNKWQKLCKLLGLYEKKKIEQIFNSVIPANRKRCPPHKCRPTRVRMYTVH